MNSTEVICTHKEVSDVGRLFKFTTKKQSWTLLIDKQTVRIDLFIKKMSQTLRLEVDGRIQFEAPYFGNVEDQHSFQIGCNVITIVIMPDSNDLFEIFVNGKPPSFVAKAEFSFNETSLLAKMPPPQEINYNTILNLKSKVIRSNSKVSKKSEIPPQISQSDSSFLKERKGQIELISQSSCQKPCESNSLKYETKTKPEVLNKYQKPEQQEKIRIYSKTPDKKQLSPPKKESIQVQKTLQKFNGLFPKIIESKISLNSSLSHDKLFNPLFIKMYPEELSLNEIIKDTGNLEIRVPESHRDSSLNPISPTKNDRIVSQLPKSLIRRSIQKSVNVDFIPSNFQIDQTSQPSIDSDEGHSTIGSYEFIDKNQIKYNSKISTTETIKTQSYESMSNCGYPHSLMKAVNRNFK